MELVTEPVIHDSKTAGDFARELQLLLRTLGVSDAHMEKGEMRVEANISLSATDELGTKVEVKNLNSFKAVEAAIAYEIKRQTELLTRGDTVVQETRGWNEHKGRTFSQRIKESADDYRYFPDPDLPSLDIRTIPEFSLSRLKEIMPELPEQKRKKYDDLGLTREQIEVIIYNHKLTTIFEESLRFCESDKELIKILANYITSDIASLISEEQQRLPQELKQFVELMRMVKEQSITSRVAKDLLPEVLFENVDPQKIAKERGLFQQNSEEDLLPVIETILNEHSSVAEEYKNGKESAIQFLVGQGMKATQGSANPTLLKELFEKNI